ncbi:MAG TPA: cytochrome c [Terriglobales bacterium]|nr:cytochrome c [Terriglobales bacterium]
MRNFVLGVIVTLLVLVLGGLAFLSFGYMPTNADAVPPRMETHIAMSALDAAMDRHAPHLNNPIPPTDENLIDGMKIYTMNCALCHGTLDEKPSPLEKSFYPPPPQVILDPMDDPEWHIFYAVRTGVRYSGMPAWGKALSEEQMWKVTAFLSRIEKLPPGVQEYWKKSFGVAPQPGKEPGEEEHKH